MRRPSQNGEMQGSEKIQAAQCIKQISGLDFFADAADCRFGAVCCSKNPKLADRSKMVRCKEAKKARARSVFIHT
jgi:hypothetical protein